MNSEQPENPAGTVLVVCTGNVCRSPYIERVLAARLADTGITVSSAGTGALVGSSMEPRVARYVVAAGGRADEFVARQVTPELVQSADLVLCATRKHRSAVVRLLPAVLHRTFALADFADLAAILGSLPDLAPGVFDETPVSRSAVARLVELVPRVRGQVTPRPDQDASIIDPYRRSDRLVSRMVQQVDPMLTPIAMLLRTAVGGS